MRVFFDTSTLVKRYIAEAGSDEVNAICLKATSMLVSVICIPEFCSTLARLKREARMELEQYKHMKNKFFCEIDSTEMIPLTPAVMSRSLVIIETSPVRAIDAIHIASAIEYNATSLVTADKQQSIAAKHAGMHVVFIA